MVLSTFLIPKEQKKNEEKKDSPTQVYEKERRKGFEV